MAHLDRHRYIETHIKEGLSFSPIVGLIGQRQVGKTTTVEQACQSHYVTLDDDQELINAQAEPGLFLTQHSSQAGKAFAIDECQKAPKLFPALKLFVQKRPRPGQFLLTGSIRFTSRKAIQESLTGRIHTLEMLPMSLAEAHRLPLGDLIRVGQKDNETLKAYIENRISPFTTTKMNFYLEHGGLPGICFLRDQSKRNAKFKSHIETLLQRDIQMIVETTTPYENLRGLLTYIAANQGQSINLANVARSTQISQATLRKLIFAFESLFLIRRMTSFGDVAAPRFYLEDQGMATYLHNYTPLENLRRFLFSQMFHQIHYRYMDVYRMGYYANRGGANVSFVFEINRNMVAMDVCESAMPNLSLLRSFNSLQEQFPKIKIYVFSPIAKVTQLTDAVTLLPLEAVI